jgi:beta-glucanase (GH16 family)
MSAARAMARSDNFFKMYMRQGLSRFSFGLYLCTCFWLFLQSDASAAWRPTWSDEFNGASLDTNTWFLDIGNGQPDNPGWGNKELEFYTSRPQNAYVSNGLLHLVARSEEYAGLHYTSAKLKSRNSFSQKFGRFEFRARLPHGNGLWPALWMMPKDAVYGHWAASGEIDVMENRGSNSSVVLGTIHFGGTFPKQTHSKGPSYTFPPGDSVTNFHVYAVEWTTNSIKWFVDQTLYQTQTNWWSAGGKYPAPFDQPFYIMMNLAVGGNFGGNPDASTIFPGEMLVDYVRAYEFVPDVERHVEAGSSEGVGTQSENLLKVNASK